MERMTELVKKRLVIIGAAPRIDDDIDLLWDSHGEAECTWSFAWPRIQIDLKGSVG
jgi:hypothetical protein